MCVGLREISKSCILSFIRRRTTYERENIEKKEKEKREAVLVPGNEHELEKSMPCCSRASSIAQDTGPVL
jgi:hypothetical protein